MIGILVCLVACVVTFNATRRSLGHGLSVLVAVGYLYGLIRARIPDGGSHFVFDAALVALYFAHFSVVPPPAILRRSERISPWAMALGIWPLICMFISPAFADTQPMIIQLVGLRSAALWVPCLVIGARLQREDLDRVARTLAILNVLALAAGLWEYTFGVESLIPRNRATLLIYMSKDVMSGRDFHYRIPSIFINSHAYGGAMCLSFPFVAHALEGKKRARILALIGMGAGGIGVFLCGSRTPVVFLMASTAYVLLMLRARWTTLVAVAICAGGLAYLVMNVERFQRFETLSDTDMVEGRINNSMNANFWDAMLTYPLGAGLASAFGTSIPYFLWDIARPQIGIENEYGRIVIEQGLPGLFLWVLLLWRSVTKPTATSGVTSAVAAGFGHGILICAWLDACIGAGMLNAIPGTLFLLSLWAGIRLGSPVESKVGLALRHVGQPREDVARAPRSASRAAPGPGGRLASPLARARANS